MWLWRSQAATTLFATTMETHGYFDEATETSLNARSAIKQVSVLHDNARESQILIAFVDERQLEVRVRNQDPGP